MMLTVDHGTAERWREMAEDDNPAGPLYTGGVFAEADMVGGGLAAGSTAACTILYACSPQSGCCAG